MIFFLLHRWFILIHSSRYKGAVFPFLLNGSVPGSVCLFSPNVSLFCIVYKIKRYITSFLDSLIPNTSVRRQTGDKAVKLTDQPHGRSLWFYTCTQMNEFVDALEN